MEYLSLMRLPSLLRLWQCSDKEWIGCWCRCQGLWFVLLVWDRSPHLNLELRGPHCLLAPVSIRGHFLSLWLLTGTGALPLASFIRMQGGFQGIRLSLIAFLSWSASQFSLFWSQLSLFHAQLCAFGREWQHAWWSFQSGTSWRCRCSCCFALVALSAARKWTESTDWHSKIPSLNKHTTLW